MSFGINQMNQLANKFTKMGWDESRVTKLGQANAKKFRAIEAILDGASLERALEAAVSVGNDTTHLRFLDSIILAPTTGSATLAQADDVFTGYLNPDFTKWGTNVAGADTEEISVGIYEMKKDGNYAMLFNSFDVDVRSLCLTQGQIKEFARSHRHLLRQDGYGTFFLFEVNGEVVVAHVDVLAGRLGAGVDRFSDGYVWRADFRYRVVVPQLAV